MMKLHRLTVGPLETNCYLVSDDEGKTAVIDPGFEPEQILAAAQKLGLTVCAVLLTHGHGDHGGGVRTIPGGGCTFRPGGGWPRSTCP